ARRVRLPGRHGPRKAGPGLASERAHRGGGERGRRPPGPSAARRDGRTSPPDLAGTVSVVTVNVPQPHTGVYPPLGRSGGCEMVTPFTGASPPGAVGSAAPAGRPGEGSTREPGLRGTRVASKRTPSSRNVGTGGPGCRAEGACGTAGFGGRPGPARRHRPGPGG